MHFELGSDIRLVVGCKGYCQGSRCEVGTKCGSARAGRKEEDHVAARSDDNACRLRAVGR